MGAAAKRERQAGADDGEVAYAASHDLRAPIVAIGQLVESIQLDFDGELPEEVVRRLCLIRQRADRCDDLLRRLNRYWRAGDTSEAAAPLDLMGMVDDIARHLAPAGAVVEAEAVTIQAPRRPLRQILCEIIDNAIRHAGRRDVRVRVAASPHAGGWELSVSDNGPGIPVRYRDRVWRLFTTLQACGTSGLGLAIVRRIALAHGGRTWIDEAPEGGARIGVFWPAPAR
ncbi:MAG TPA: HAMP domain-containing sensor histidine kinase [Kofleriaceae bacterium]|jgi:signal transduction histidine kinase